MDWFHLISELVNLDEKELKKKYDNAEVMETIKLAFNELSTNDNFPQQVNFDEFVKIIYKLNDILKKCGREFGNIIIKSSEISDNGDNETAIKILNNFIATCPSKFFRKQALDRINDYK